MSVAPLASAVTPLAEASGLEVHFRRRGRIVRAANCSFSSRSLGTMTSASTVQNGTRSRFAYVVRQRSGSRSGFSSPITSAG